MCIEGRKKHSFKDTYPICAWCGVRYGNAYKAHGPKKVGKCLSAILDRHLGDPMAEGYDDYNAGVPATLNPYPDTVTNREKRTLWQEGWEAGLEDRFKRKAS